MRAGIAPVDEAGLGRQTGFSDQRGSGPAGKTFARRQLVDRVGTGDSPYGVGGGVWAGRQSHGGAFIRRCGVRLVPWC